MKAWQISLAIFVVYYVVVEYWYEKETVITCSPAAPTVEHHDGFLAPPDFETLAKFVLSHDIVGNMTQKAEAAGKRGEGGVEVWPWVRFNTRGVRRLCKRTEWTPLCEALQKVRLEKTNAFVVKIMVAVPTTKEITSFFASSLELQEGGPVLLLDKRNEWVPHEVNIVDLLVPNNMTGGELEVFEVDRTQRKSKMNKRRINVDGAAYVLPPQPNRLFSLRGDTYYTYTDFSITPNPPPAAARRVALVIEQFVLGKEQLGLSGELEVWTGTEHQRTERDALLVAAGAAALIGGAVGAITQSRVKQDETRVIRIAVAAVVGAAGGGACGFGFGVAVQAVLRGAFWALAQFWTLSETMFVHSPEATRIVVLGVLGTAVWIFFMYIIRIMYWMDRGVFNFDGFDWITHAFLGEKAADMTEGSKAKKGK